MLGRVRSYSDDYLVTLTADVITSAYKLELDFVPALMQV